MTTNVIASLLESVAPTLATALLGPLGGVAVNFIADKLGVDKTNEAVTNALTGMTADQLVKMKEMDLDFQKHMSDNGIAIDTAQIQTNTAEASSQSTFVSGARPFIIWVGGFGLAYASILEPLLRFTAQVGFHYTGSFPVIDTATITHVLLGVLGLSGLRSLDKFNGVETK